MGWILLVLLVIVLAFLLLAYMLVRRFVKTPFSIKMHTLVWIPCFVLPALLLYATEVVDHRSTNIILACYAAGLVVSVTGAAMALSAIRRHGIHVLSALRALGSSIIMVVGFILLSVFDTHL